MATSSDAPPPPPPAPPPPPPDVPPPPPPPPPAPEPSSDAPAAAGPPEETKVKCMSCRKDKMERSICKKEGPNKGRPFWRCSNCGNFESADGREWITGRTMGDHFFPFKRFLDADPTLKKSYSTLPPQTEMEMDARGMAFLCNLLEVASTNHRGRAFDRGSGNKDKVFCIRLDRELKISHTEAKVFVVEKKIQKHSPGGYAYKAKLYDIGTITCDAMDVWHLNYVQESYEADATALRQFIAGLGTNAELTLGEMGKCLGCCCMCGRLLSDPDSKHRGYGPICAGYVARIIPAMKK